MGINKNGEGRLRGKKNKEQCKGGIREEGVGGLKDGVGGVCKNVDSGG